MLVPKRSAAEVAVVPLVGPRIVNPVLDGEVIVIVAPLLPVARLVPAAFKRLSTGVVTNKLLLLVTVEPLRIPTLPATSAEIEIVPVVDPPFK